MEAVTDTTALQERLWDTIAEVRDAHPRVHDDAPTDDVVAAVLPIIRRAQAESWEKGYTAGAVDTGLDEQGETPNPYEQEEA